MVKVTFSAIRKRKLFVYVFRYRVKFHHKFDEWELPFKFQGSKCFELFSN